MAKYTINYVISFLNFSNNACCFIGSYSTLFVCNVLCSMVFNRSTSKVKLLFTLNLSHNTLSYFTNNFSFGCLLYESLWRINKSTFSKYKLLLPKYGFVAYKLENNWMIQAKWDKYYLVKQISLALISLIVFFFAESYK